MRLPAYRTICICAAFAAYVLAGGSVAIAADTSAADRFDYLSTHGNSNCSVAFRKSIATMPATARLQGSCCSPMDRDRYTEQVQGLTKYAAIREIPPDPYDISAGVARKMMPYYDLALTPEERQVYQYAMQHSDERGPCCCKCWRWHMYGGLAKYLIRARHFSGKQISEVWNLSDGCGGASHREDSNSPPGDQNYPPPRP